MKRIGILTFHRAYNYGAQIQSYALSAYLKRKYPQAIVEIIDYQSVAEKKYYCVSVIRNAIKVGFSAAKQEIIRNRYFRKFAAVLPISKYRIISDNAEKILKIINGKYDAVIVGSDAIFNWNLRKFPVPYYLGADLNCLKISYAASAHALQYNKATEDQIKYCGNALSEFDYLGVRDTHTEKFVNYCIPDKKVFHNCDPSLLLDMQDIDYNKIEKILKTHNVDLSKPLIVVMTADEKIVRPIYDMFGDSCEFISLYLTNPIVKKFISKLSPLEWAGIFKFAKITITEYFHGTLLSLKNYTPVISVDRTDESEGYSGKIKDVLYDRMQLKEMYYPYSSIGTDEYKKRAELTIKKALKNEYENVIKNAIKEEVKNVETFEAFLKNHLFKR